MPKSVRKPNSKTQINNIAYCPNCRGRFNTTKTKHEHLFTMRVKLCEECGTSVTTCEVLKSYYDKASVAFDSANGVALSHAPSSSPIQPAPEPAVAKSQFEAELDALQASISPIPARAPEPERQPDPLPAQVIERAPTYDEWLEQNKRADNVNAWEEWSHIPGVELPPDPEDQEGFTGYGGEAA